MKRIVIAGGTGFLGKILTERFKNEYQVVILTRGADKTSNGVSYVHWDGKTAGPWVDVTNGAEVVINLNGKSVDCRYTEKNKALIYATRLDATEALDRAIQEVAQPPKLWINASSATIYRHSLDKVMDERGEFGTGFSVDVCQRWEAMFNKFDLPGTRKVLLRTGIVLGKDGGPLKPLKMLARLGFGGKQGRGDQYFSWLHEDDFASIVDFIIHHQTCEGVYNVTAPNPIPNADIMRSLRAALHMPIGIPLPEWLLKVGAGIIQTENELVLKSRRVVPARLFQEGYSFKYADIRAALKDLV
jgi:uncharacterized protein (TIGR01777 family)